MTKTSNSQVFRFTFKWIDDAAYNRGFKECDGYFIGTQKEFAQMCSQEEFGQGFSCWDVEKVPASADDLREYEYWK